MERPELSNPLTNGKIIGSNIDSKDYHRQNAKRGEKDFVMSRGELFEFAKCPHRWLMGYEEEETKAIQWGSLMDCMALTPERFESDYAITPAVYKDAKTGEEKPWNWNANVCKEWRRQHRGKQLVKPETVAEAKKAVSVLMADLPIRGLIKGSQRQVMVTAEYHDKETGVVVSIKTLIDVCPVKASPFDESLADLKTTNSAALGSWTQHVYKFGYHWQAAMYLDAYNCAGDDKRIEFLHIVQENYSPFETGRRLLSQEYVELGRLAYLAALTRYCRCLATGKWPGYDDDENSKTIINGWQLVQPSPFMVMPE